MLDYRARHSEAPAPQPEIAQDVDASAVAALIKQLPVVEFPRGHTIYAEGEPGDRLYVIVSGKVKLTRRTLDGRARLLTVIGPPDMFGALSTLEAGPRTASAAAITPVHAASMDRDAIRARIRDNLIRDEQTDRAHVDTLAGHGLALVAAGRTTMAEVRRAVALQ